MLLFALGGMYESLVKDKRIIAATGDKFGEGLAATTKHYNKLITVITSNLVLQL